MVWFLIDALAASAMSPEESAVATQRVMAPIMSRLTSAPWAPPLAMHEGADPAGLLDAFVECLNTISQ